MVPRILDLTGKSMHVRVCGAIEHVDMMDVGREAYLHRTKTPENWTFSTAVEELPLHAK
jgi:hypothetical protein